MCSSSFSAGVGRSGTFIALDQMNAEQTVDIKCTVKKMREKGMYMIQTAARELAFHSIVLTYSYHTVRFWTSLHAVMMSRIPVSNLVCQNTPVPCCFIIDSLFTESLEWWSLAYKALKDSAMVHFIPPILYPPWVK